MHDYFIITGKGFPDFATSKLVHNLAACLPDVPIYGLVDSDPYGLMIFIKYKFGSKVAYQSHLMAVPRIIYLGVSITDYHSGWLPMTEKDCNMALNILSHPHMTMSELKVIKDELQMQLFLGKKAEMNIASKNGSKGITAYIRNKLLKYEK